jgi:hypothetical protein
MKSWSTPPATPSKLPQRTDDSYEELVSRLAELAARAETERAEARSWYEGQCTAADRAVREASDTLRRARAELDAAQEDLDAIETEVTHLWQRLRAQLGSAGRRIGDPPMPVRGAGSDPRLLLTAVRELLDRTRKPGELPTSAHPLLALFGIGGAVLAYLIGTGARLVGERYGGDLAMGMPVLALVVTLLGPVVGLAPAKLLADRRHATIDFRAVAVVVVAGVLTTAALLASLR